LNTQKILCMFFFVAIRVQRWFIALQVALL
jgi:hypothetical protein